MTVAIKNIEDYSQAVLANDKPDLAKRTRGLVKATAGLPRDVVACLRELRESGVSFQYDTWRQCPMSTVALTKAPGKCDIPMVKKAIKSGLDMLDDALDVLVTNKNIQARFAKRTVTDRRAYGDDLTVYGWLGEKYGVVAREVQTEHSVVALLELGGVKIDTTQVYNFAEAWDGVAKTFAKSTWATRPDARAVAILDKVLKVKARKATSKGTGKAARKN